MRTFAVAVTSTLVLFACGKKAPKPEPLMTAPPSAEDAAAAPAPDAAPAPAPAPDAAAAPAPDAAAAPAPDTAAPAPEAAGAAAEQCGRIVAKAWKAIQPALAKLQVPDAASLEAKFTTESYDTKDFLEKCPAAPKPYRDCIEAADNPIHFIRPCAASLPDPKPDELPALKLPGKSPLLAPVALPAGEGDKLVAKIAGTWKSEDTYSSETWVIDAKGKVEVTRMRDGKVEEKSSLDSFSVSFENVGTMTVHYAGNNQTRSFYLADDGKTLYTSGNLMWSVYPLGDEKTFVAINGFDWVFMAPDKCEVVTYQGSVVPATCTFAERDGKRFFDVSYQEPGKVRWGTTEPEPTKGSFQVFGASLLAADLVAREAYTRQ